MKSLSSVSVVSMFSCWHLSPIQWSLSSFILPVFLLPFFPPLSSVYIYTPWTVFFFLRQAFIPAFSCSLLLQASNMTCPCYEWCLSRCPLSSDVVYSGGAHTCISRQGWLWLSCPLALKVESGRVRQQKRGWAERSGRLRGMRDQRWEKKEEKR